MNLNRCEVCIYCTNKRVTADEQIGLCTEPHGTMKDINGVPRKQVRLWQPACKYFKHVELPNSKPIELPKEEPAVTMKRGRKPTN